MGHGSAERELAATAGLQASAFTEARAETKMDRFSAPRKGRKTIHTFLRLVLDQRLLVSLSGSQTYSFPAAGKDHAEEGKEGCSLYPILADQS
jgi:hypothetical protein